MLSRLFKKVCQDDHASYGLTSAFNDVQVAGEAVNHFLMQSFHSDEGIHPESYLCAVGALSGYACQDAIRELYKEGGIPEEKVLKRMTTKEGQTYYYGDDLRRSLSLEKFSVWALIKEAGEKGGCNQLPSFEEMFNYVASTIDSEYFGFIRVPKKHQPRERSINYLKKYWDQVHPIVMQNCSNRFSWPLAYASAGQIVMESVSHRVDPKISVRIIMESAIAMSKVELK